MDSDTGIRPSDPEMAYAYVGSKLALAELMGVISPGEPLKLAERIHSDRYRQVFLMAALATSAQERIPPRLIEWREAKHVPSYLTETLIGSVRVILGIEGTS